MCKFGDYVRYFTTDRIIIYVVTIWFISFFTYFPNHIGWGKIRFSYMIRLCTFDTDLMSYTYFYATVSTIAIIITFIYYLKIYLVIRRSKLCLRVMLKNVSEHFKSETYDDVSVDCGLIASCLPMSMDELKIVKSSFKIFLTFLITWCPLCILFFIHYNVQIPPWVYLYAAMLAHCNSTLNFFVYFVENSLFRREFTRIFALKKIDKH